MFSFLKNHPFPVEAFFESSLVLTFAVPKKELRKFIPECLELDTFEDEWAFVAVAMVKTSALRPKGLPKFLGNDFFLIGYRIFVKYTNSTGKRVRGLYIIKSETDKRKLMVFGNIFTNYKYTLTDISLTKNAGQTEIKSVKSNFSVAVEESNEEVALPSASPFANWKEARRFAGPLPFTFTYNREKKTVLIIEGVRQNWKPEPVRVNNHNISFWDDMKLKNIVLANAFIIKNVPYYWKRGRIERWEK